MSPGSVPSMFYVFIQSDAVASPRRTIVSILENVGCCYAQSDSLI